MLVDTFANRLKSIMYAKGIKASELSSKTHISKSQISHWLNGTYKAKQDSLTILANFFNVNEAWLMGYDVPKDKNNISISQDNMMNNNDVEEFKKLLIDKGFLDKNGHIIENAEELLDFAIANKDFIIKKKNN